MAYSIRIVQRPQQAPEIHILLRQREERTPVRAAGNRPLQLLDFERVIRGHSN